MTHPSVNSIVERLRDPRYCGQEAMRQEAATIISDLQAEAKLSDERIQRLQAAVAFWMPGVSALVETETNGYAGDSACLLYGFNGEVPSDSWGDKMLARALAAESSLSRIKEETIEECAKVADDRADGWFSGEPKTVYGQGYKAGCRNAAIAIRSLDKNCSGKTAEGGHFAPTRERE